MDFCGAHILGVQQAFRKMNDGSEFARNCHNLTLPLLLNNVRKARQNLENIVVAHLNPELSHPSK
jgi:hypothetical protein